PSPLLFFLVSAHLPVLPSFPTRRSSDLHAGDRGGRVADLRHELLDRGGQVGLRVPRRLGQLHDPTALLQGRGRRGARPLGLLLQDRKSTRLNSSHVKISYAVFCLKKKKK